MHNNVICVLKSTYTHALKGNKSLAAKGTLFALSVRFRAYLWLTYFDIHVEESAPPPPPPMPAAVSTISLNDIAPLKSATKERKMSIRSTTTIGEEGLQDELTTVLTLFRENKKRHLDIKQTPSVYINQRSSPDEVTNWLEAKEFSDLSCRKLRNFAGHQILALGEDQLRKICGEKEGNRLHAHLLIQKNVCGVSISICINLSVCTIEKH